MKMKLINDSVHGSIRIHSACIRIIDTPQFQRLRDIKQMGTTCFVYPGGSYSRFEHSIGTCYLAGEYGRHLRAACPDVGITDKDILCLEIAGLCHDLGHGPFSHLWEQFMSRMGYQEWKHERMSLDMLDHLLDENKLRDGVWLDDSNKMEATDWLFVKELIWGGPVPNQQVLLKKEPFFYEIINNKSTGIDVDKWDYILRDGLHLNIHSCFEYKRVMEFSKVLRVDGDLRIAYRDKEMYSLYELFTVRERLHRKAYQHRVCKVIDQMLIDAFELADDKKFITLDDSTEYKLSESWQNMQAYEKLSDYIYFQILHGPKCLARSLLERIYRRDFYPYVGCINLKKQKGVSLYESVLFHRPRDLSREDIVFSKCLFNYGRKEEDPLNNAYLFTKQLPDVAVRKKPIDGMAFPTAFEEKMVLVFVRSNDKLEMATVMLESWMKEQEEDKVLVNGDHQHIVTWTLTSTK